MQPELNATICAAAILAASAGGATYAEPGTAAGDRVHETGDMCVTASPLQPPAGLAGRLIETVTEPRISQTGSSSVSEALERLTSVSVRQRGAHEVQSDLSIRGSTFQQVQVTLNGFPLSDPQTAHHNMDLPFPIEAVERIDVIAGPGTAIYGPSAFAGAVNILTRIPDANGMRAGVSRGSFGTWRGAVSADGVARAISTVFAVSHERSDGFQDGADYRTWCGWGSARALSENCDLRVSAGYRDNDFGAQDFYAVYPSRELTRLAFAELAPTWDLGSGWHVAGAARFRRHEDEFILFRDDPARYRNEHVSHTWTEQIVVLPPAGALGATSVGIERSDASLDSSNMGNRSTAMSSIFGRHRARLGPKWNADLGMRCDRHNRWGTEISPSLSIGGNPVDPVGLRISAGRAIRPPDFTELYYADPANSGNPGLRPETAWGAESGFDLVLGGGVTVSATCFWREARDLIDWMRASETDVWQATNLSENVTSGAELFLAGQLWRMEWHAGYGYTDVDAASTELESKYALNYARHDLRVGLALPETRGWTGSITARYRDVRTLDEYCLVSARLGKRIGPATVFGSGANLLNEEYNEIPGVPTAGRSFEFGMETRF